MEGLTPPLKCLIEIQSAAHNGEAIRLGITKYLAQARETDDFAPVVRAFLFAWDQGHDWKSVIMVLKSPHRRALLEVVACGLSGQSIMSHLDEIREEMMSATEFEIREHLEILPLKMLMPLLMLQFPAFLLLLFGPLLRHLIEELNK
jgi:hypothetical protein